MFTKKGVSVIFITHKIKEALEISNRITVLRLGKLVATIKADKTTPVKLANMMVGREMTYCKEKGKMKQGDLVLEVKDLRALNDAGRFAVNGVSFSVRQGEILGVAGVSGNGQLELAEAIVGLRKVQSGKLMIRGKDITNKNTDEIMQGGVGYIPEDRINKGLLMSFDVSQNLILGSHHKAPFADSGPSLMKKITKKKLFFNSGEVKQYSKKLITEYDIKTPSEETYVANLSGGNLQKLILARVLSQKPHLLIASSPTRGLDIGAADFVTEKLIDESANGTSILLFSTDLDEILKLSDRIAVIFAGKIVGILDSDKCDISKIGLLMAGVKDPKILKTS
jgi:simple sugar transport system ATP-binding protein